MFGSVWDHLVEEEDTWKQRIVYIPFKVKDVFLDAKGKFPSRWQRMVIAVGYFVHFES